jgi:hypothetical protein
MSKSLGKHPIGRLVRNGKEHTEVYLTLCLHVSFIGVLRAFELCPPSVKKFILRNSYGFSAPEHVNRDLGRQAVWTRGEWIWLMIVSFFLFVTSRIKPSGLAAVEFAC